MYYSKSIRSVRYSRQLLNSICGSFGNHLKYLAVIPVILLFSQSVSGIYPGDKAPGAKKDTLRKTINLFSSDELLNVTLSFDLTGFMKKAAKAGSYDGSLLIHKGENDSLAMNVTIKHRGEFRYQTCSFPPIMLNFKKPYQVVSDSGKFKKIKLVTHCNPGSASDDYVLREYLVYKLYNVLSDTSFRVRLLKVTYLDTQKKRKPITQYGFFIEPVEVVAGRTNSIVLKAENLNQTHIIPPNMDKVAIFNYMIANWDWSVPGQHNVALLKSKNINQSSLGIAIPYDFDLCGVVNADYGTPAPEMGLKSSRDRRFAGICRDKETIVAELKSYLEKKEKLYSVVNEFPHLNQRSKKDIISFLDEFFTQIEKPRDLEYLVNRMLESCKKL